MSITENIEVKPEAKPVIDMAWLDMTNEVMKEISEEEQISEKKEESIRAFSEDIKRRFTEGKLVSLLQTMSKPVNGDDAENLGIDGDLLADTFGTPDFENVFGSKRKFATAILNTLKRAFAGIAVKNGKLPKNTKMSKAMKVAWRTFCKANSHVEDDQFVGIGEKLLPSKEGGEIKLSYLAQLLIG